MRVFRYFLRAYPWQSLVMLLCLLLATGCASNEFAQQPGREADDLPMIALEGFRDAERLYVSYRQGDAVYFAGGDWGERVESSSSADGDM